MRRVVYFAILPDGKRITTSSHKPLKFIIAFARDYGHRRLYDWRWYDSEERAKRAMPILMGTTRKAGVNPSDFAILPAYFEIKEMKA